MIDDIENENAKGYDPTGSTENEDIALWMITISGLIQEMLKKYSKADTSLHLIIDGYQKNEIIEQVDLGKGKV